jgi:hypothetical protein
MTRSVSYHPSSLFDRFESKETDTPPEPPTDTEAEHSELPTDPPEDRPIWLRFNVHHCGINLRMEVGTGLPTGKQFASAPPTAVEFLFFSATPSTRGPLGDVAFAGAQ